jgi:pSer/pThr/pTyr-binding forkhead associated (FHA) protein
MSLKEALAFLELPDTATDNQVGVGLADKLKYFQKLMENAPNEFLRNLHAKNIEKIKGFQALLPPQTAPANSRAYENQKPVHPSITAYHSDLLADKEVLAFLIRHTEQQSIKTYPLYEGKNIIGRTIKNGSYNPVVIDDDNYVSRVHAIIDIKNDKNIEITISDDAISNGARASKNGTYVNGNEKRIKNPLSLSDNDTIQIGMTKLILRYNNININQIIDEVEESNYMKTVVINLF